MSDFNCEDIYDEHGLKRFLRYHNLRPDKDKGQHFLTNEAVLQKISTAVRSGGTVIEVGAGPGSLTCKIKDRFEKTFAVEIDEKFRGPFKDLNPEDSVNFVAANFLDLDFKGLDLEKNKSSRLVGNIPYNVTGRVLKKAVSNREYFSESVFTVQKEVAERILADPGTSNSGAITYYIQAYGEVSHVVDIPPKDFYPPPAVDSSTIKIKYGGDKKFNSRDEIFLSLIRGLFNYRRKTARKGLIVSPKFSLNKDEVDNLLGEASINGGKRPEELTLEDFDRLALVFQKNFREGCEDSFD